MLRLLLRVCTVQRVYTAVPSPFQWCEAHTCIYTLTTLYGRHAAASACV